MTSKGTQPTPHLPLPLAGERVSLARSSALEQTSGPKEERTVTSNPHLAVDPKSVIFRPDSDTLRELTAAMPQASKTVFDNYNVSTKVTARSKRSTFLIDVATARRATG